MIRCDICKKTVFDGDKTIVDWVSIKEATNKGFIPSYYLERDKEGIEYGLPKERKWRNIVKNYPKDNMELCKSCFTEMKELKNSKSTGAMYCFIATAAYDSPYAKEVKILRKYRDEVLMKTISGRMFVNSYYVLSPPVARIISKSESLKSLTKKVIIKPLLKHISKN